MRAVCPQVPVERPGSLRYETSSFRKDHRPGFCPRPCGTSLCPWICLQISRRLLRFGILLLKLLSPNLLPVLPLQAKLCLQILPNSACKRRSTKARCQQETPGEQTVQCCSHRAGKTSRARLPLAEPA